MTDASSIQESVTIPGDVVAWLRSGERGISSETIVDHLFGVGVLCRGRGSHPHDPDDLRRCMLMLEACPSVRVRFDEMRRASRVWARLVDAWPRLTDSLRREMARDDGYARETYATMREVIECGHGEGSR